ncbi:MAG: ABC transporter ATP-binding protein [Gemmataceae bacterium]
MSVAIVADKLSKVYRIGAAHGAYRTLRETLMDLAWQPWRKLRGWCGRAPEAAEDPQQLWALRDVSFEIKAGESVGIIGRNGAGKSTLLKILSRVTEPTSGRAQFRGRVGSLLEIGTGFHNELTGRENIYLSGVILGMTRREIARKFDDIVGFAEMERFLDTPVKRYSSGMYVRLAFAVAAHLDPEILMIDEVLAVGDTAYQRRCLDRLSKFSLEGRTVLFVSHNMDFVPRLCQRGILLDHGQISYDGPVALAIQEYFAHQFDREDMEDLVSKRHDGDGRARFTRAQLVHPGQPRRLTHVAGDDLVVRMEVDAQEALERVQLTVGLKTMTETTIITGWTEEVDFPVEIRPGRQAFECRFQQVHFRPGHRFQVMLWMEDDGGLIDTVHDALVVDVCEGEQHTAYAAYKYLGIVSCSFTWSRLESFDE